MQAEMLLGLCRQFKALPSAVLAEDAELLRLLKIEELGSAEQPTMGLEDLDG